MLDAGEDDPDRSKMTQTDPAVAEPVKYRIRREAETMFGRMRDALRQKWWLRWGAILLGLGLALLVLGWVVLARNLPDAESLLDYQPPLPSVVRGIDGEIVHSYARERRVQLQFKDLPTQLLNAYTSAEDKTFWTHAGVDLGGFVGAVIDYVSKIGSGERAVGGSTITQQVAKNILVGNEYSITRKLKEMILANRVEQVLTKPEIITLYLNEIPLGRRSFGVQAASRTYFNKDVGDLELHEMAYLAILPKAPETYSREKNFNSATRRRNIVLGQMVGNGHISEAQANAARALPLGIVEGSSLTQQSADAGYYLEEVRRKLMEMYGEQAEDGPYSVYAGGLWVRTSLDVEMQSAAQKALRNALIRHHGNSGWAGPIATINMNEGNWAGQLASSYLSTNHADWRIGVVTSRNGASARIGFSDGEEFPLSSVPNDMKAGDVIAASPNGSGWRVRNVPEVSGGFLAQDPFTGRVLAVQGGFDARLTSLNRATQANRQPGSTVKPFVYATGLDNGMTPATMVPDSQYCYYQGSNLGEKCFTNYGGSRGGGEYPMRYGLEQSKNLMTVHIAMDSGMEKVVKTFSDLQIGDYEPYPAFALGAGETTVLKMVNAYSALANHGRMHKASFIDYVQDRTGKVIWTSETRDCTGCNMDEWDGRAMPRFNRRGTQVMDARTAFQTVNMLTGVVKRGTAVRLRDLDIPLFGKTGTSSGPTNAWFVGGSSDLIAGLYIGYDTPRNMGGWVQGGNTAAPVFKDFAKQIKHRFSGKPFVAPEGVRMVRVDRRTGKRVFDGWPTSDPKTATIWEAFKPDTEPPRAQRKDDIDRMREIILAQLRRRKSGGSVAKSVSEEEEPESFAEEQGGLY